MKKFLTVLLALSVVFTYTVGTAFATVPDVTQDARAAAEKFAENIADTAGKAAALAHKDDYSAKAITDATADASKFIMNTIVDQLLKDLKDDDVDINTTDGMKAYEDELNEWAGIVGGSGLTYIKTSAYVPAGSNLSTYTYDALFTYYADTREFDARVNEALEALKINTSIYSDRAYDSSLTYRQKADQLIEAAKGDVEKVTTASKLKSPGGDEIKAADATNDSNYKDVLNGILYGYEYKKASSNDALYISKVYTAKDNKYPATTDANDPTADDATIATVAGLMGQLDGLLLVADEPAADDAAKTDLEHAKADLAYYAKVTYYNTVKVDAGADVSARLTDGKCHGVSVKDPANITKAEASDINAAIMKEINETLEVVNVYLEETSAAPVTDVTNIKTDKFTIAQNNNKGFADLIAPAKAARDKYDDAAVAAANMKKALLFNGTKKYDDAVIEAALAKDKTAIYAEFLTGTWAFLADSKLNEVPALSDEVMAAINAAKNKFQPTIILSGANKTEEADKKYCKSYYDTAVGADYDVIEAETQAKLWEAKTVEEVNAIMAEADAKLAELRTAADKNAAFDNEVTKYKEALAQYAAEQLKLMNADKAYRTDSFNTGANSALKEGEKMLDEAKNAAALPGVYEEAKALFKTIKTDADLKTAAGAVETLIAALPDTAAKDLSNEDQFLAAKKAYDEYLDLFGTAKTDIKGYAQLESKLSYLKGYQQDAVIDAIKALDKLKPIGSNDKEAVQNVRDMLEKYLEIYDVDSATYTGVVDAYNDGDKFDIVSTNLTALIKAEAEVKAAEVDDVVALISKLDEKSSVEELATAKAAYDALSGSQQRSVKGYLGEAFLYKLEMIEKAQIKAVESLKLKASSKLYKGKKIRVNWKVAGGDASAIDGYRVYKSTKMNSGYKFMGKTKKLYMDNKKELKKGKRYFYKVRAYKVVDGKTYYSDYSNLANRYFK